MGWGGGGGSGAKRPEHGDAGRNMVAEAGRPARAMLRAAGGRERAGSCIFRRVAVCNVSLISARRPFVALGEFLMRG